MSKLRRIGAPLVAHRHAVRLAAVLAFSFSLVACGGGNTDEAHDDTHVESTGRLALIEDGAANVRFYDLDEARVIASFALANPPSAVYASPDRRYAVLPQRSADRVQFADGGLWQEDHGDHLHDYQAAPALLGFALDGALPTHYEAHDGLAALFFDGAEASAAPAGVRVFGDAEIGAGASLAALTLPQAMHGTAEPRGGHLLTTYRPVGAASTLPTQVEHYRRNGSGYDFIERFAAECPALHGSYSNASHSVFGCSDGVLVIRQSGESFSASKIANPADMPAGARIGTVVGHGAHDEFIGIASPGLLFLIEPDAGRITRLTWDDARTRRAHAFDATGENFVVLDDLGTLHFLDPESGWAVRATLAAVPAMPSAAPFPTLAASHAAEALFLADPLGRQLIEIDTHEASITRRRALDFAPSGLAWLGIASHEHDDHAH